MAEFANKNINNIVDFPDRRTLQNIGYSILKSIYPSDIIDFYF